jgi:hypothetical protein
MSGDRTYRFRHIPSRLKNYRKFAITTRQKVARSSVACPQSATPAQPESGGTSSECVMRVTAAESALTVGGWKNKGDCMRPTDDVPWPLASSPERARWATQAVERYLHMARIIMSRAATWPGPEVAFPPQALDLAQQLCADLISARQQRFLGRR